jgi:uncharacterized membrane protein
MVRAKYVVFALIAVMTGYVLYHNERFLIEPDHPMWDHYGNVGWWLIPHGIAGAGALLMAPLQFSDRLRKRFTRLHRVGGRIYVFGVFVLAPVGAYIQYQEEAMGLPRTFTLLATVNAVMLYVTTGIAFAFALQRRITLHRQWMTRSYAVALAFFANRFVLGVTGLETAGVEMVQAVIWACLAMSVILGDVANDWSDFRRAVPSRAGAGAVSARQPQSGAPLPASVP